MSFLNRPPRTLRPPVGSRGAVGAARRGEEIVLVSVRRELFEVREPASCVRGRAKVPTKCVCLSL